MKILITEEQYKLLNELFSGDIYPYKLTGNEKRGYSMTYYYEFNTKNEITYKITMSIRPDRLGRIDFYTEKVGEWPNTSGYLNTHDSIKVFNTIKSILEKNKDKIDTLILFSDKKRTIFYKKLLKYFNIKYKIEGDNRIVATLNPQKKCPFIVHFSYYTRVRKNHATRAVCVDEETWNLIQNDSNSEELKRRIIKHYDEAYYMHPDKIEISFIHNGTKPMIGITYDDR